MKGTKMLYALVVGCVLAILFIIWTFCAMSGQCSRAEEAKPDTLRAEDMIAHWEGYSPFAYKCSAGVWTLGYGRTVDVNEGDTTNEAAEREWMCKRADVIRKSIQSCLLVELHPNQVEVLVSLAYNVGLVRLYESEGWKYLQEGNIASAAFEFFDPVQGFVKADGKIINGLVNRRTAEREIFNGGKP